ncbi:MAG: DUF1841 family protein [Deltaproteobacteria bacterium]|nr:DUF1841 family protein [Deltaproteobacteria bacterium]
MKDPIPKDLKKLTGEHHQAIWESAKKGELHGLSPEDRKTAEIMLAHEEFHNQFEIADLLSEHEYDPEREVNPFLHVTLHVITETQLENRDPIEVFQFYNAMRKKNASHHEAIHLIGIVFTPLMFDTFRAKKPFDLEEYRSRLNKMKALKPEKIFASIAKEEEPL